MIKYINNDDDDDVMMWEMKTETVPVVTGLIKKGLEKDMEKIPNQHQWSFYNVKGRYISKLQKISLLRTAHILRKVLR